MTAASASTVRRLRNLRVRVTILIALLVATVTTLLATVVIRFDAERRDQQIDAELLQQVDEVARQVAFVDGELEPQPPEDLVSDTTALVVLPDVDIFDLDSDELDSIAEPSDEQMRFWLRDVVFDLDDGQRALLREVYGLDPVDDPTEVDSRLVELVVADPPGEAWDEAYRRYFYDVADDRGIDLNELTQEHFWTGEILDDGVVAEAYDYVVFDDADGRLLLDGPGGELYARGTPLLDGLEARGAVVAFAEAEEFDAAHRQLQNQVVLAAALLIMAAVGAAWFVAGRTIRPVAQALGQQERFLADAAHELRTPITAIRATAESALATGPTDEDSERVALGRIAAVASNASTMADELMTLARIDANGMPLSLEPVRLDLLVESVIDGDPAFRLDARATVVSADSNLLSRAIDNLLRNAIAHGEATAETPAAVTVRDQTVVVRDWGPGLNPSEHDEVFERFRTSSSSRGHGLGLPLARWIARAHGGDVVVGHANPGAEFVLTVG